MYNMCMEPLNTESNPLAPTISSNDIPGSKSNYHFYINGMFSPPIHPITPMHGNVFGMPDYKECSKKTA